MNNPSLKDKINDLLALLNKARYSMNTISLILIENKNDILYINWISKLSIIFLSLINYYENNLNNIIDNFDIDVYKNTFIGLYAIQRRLSGIWSIIPNLPVEPCWYAQNEWYNTHSVRFWRDIKKIHPVPMWGDTNSVFSL